MSGGRDLGQRQEQCKAPDTGLCLVNSRNAGRGQVRWVAHHRCQGQDGVGRRPGLGAGHPALRPELLGLGGVGLPRLLAREFHFLQPHFPIVCWVEAGYAGPLWSSPMPLSYCLFPTIRTPFLFLCSLLLKFKFLKSLPSFLPCFPRKRGQT